jgi:hypothetical protein
MLYRPPYASALRCIGQALENHNIDLFELVITEADEFIVECGDPNPPYTGVLKLQFSPDSIKIIDREGQARRRRTRSELRFDSLPETLRATGKYLDSKRAELRRVSNCCPSEAGKVELEYQTRAGDVQSETLDMSLIREVAVNMYKRRTSISNPINTITRRN